ncbi:MAG TPA: hypothetical protein VF101_02020 [Gaiellaceae bacterium]
MKNPDRPTVIALIDETVATLRGAPSPEELQAGWSQQNRAIVVRVLERLRRRLEDPSPLRPGDVRPSLSRDIDDLGIDPNSCLAQRIAEISNKSNRLQ